MLRHLETRSRIEIRTGRHESFDDPQVRVRAMGEALYARVNPRFTPSTMAREFVGLSIADMARETLRRSGVSITGLAAPALIERALHTTSDFALILGDTVGRSLARRLSGGRRRHPHRGTRDHGGRFPRQDAIDAR